jgi:hypothetical protein
MSHQVSIGNFGVVYRTTVSDIPKWRFPMGALQQLDGLEQDDVDVPPWIGNLQISIKYHINHILLN